MAGKLESRKASPVCHDARCSLVKQRPRKWKNAVYLIKIRFCLFCDSLCLPLLLIFILLFSVLATETTFLSLLSLYFRFFYWGFLELCFYFFCLFLYQQVRYPCSSPFGWEGYEWFSVVLEYPTASPSCLFSLLLHSTLLQFVPFFLYNRVALLFLLSTSVF